ncbi:SurA N-terminal domain-containing protein [Marinicaulis aureus]|uniref:Parvulin-like PPIase n=1 Tax=Hyphococcus aureus TaxID=2666033 RepID=A0ABW1KXP9_9PROT
MLSQVRGALKGAVAWIVIILLVAAFALWQVPNASQLLANSAVTVGNESFSQRTVSSEFDQTFQRASRESGGGLTREEAVASGMARQVVDRLVTQSALDQYAQKMNLALPRSAIRDYLQESEMFQNPATGAFDRTTLENILLSNGLSVKQFETMMHDDLRRSQLVEALVSEASAPDSLMDAMVLRETERRRVAYLTVTDEMSGEAAEPTPEDLQAYYQENEEVFTAPEYRTFDLLVLRADDFREGLEASEDEMRRLYEAGKDRLYSTQETRTLYQITYETEAEAEAAVADLAQGESFESLALERGMTLDAVTFADATQSQIVDPAVGAAAFEAGVAEGAVVGPVRSLFGWTVAQVAAVTPGEERSFEDVRPELEASFLDNDVRRRMQDALDEIEEVRDTGAELAEAAEAAGYTLETFGPIDRVSFAPGGAIIDKVPGEAIAEAFQLDEGEQSEALRLATEDGYFFVSLREIIPPALKPYDYVEAEVEQRWRADERRERIENTVAAIREAVAAGDSLNDVADTYGRAPIELVIDRRFTNEVINKPFNEKIFFAKLNDLVSSTVGNNGAQVIAEVREIGFGRSAISPAEEARLAELVGMQLDQELISAFVEGIREDYGVKINQTQIDAIFSDGF